MVAGWLCREQEGVIDYLNEENRVLRELMGTKRLPVLGRQRHQGHVDGRYYLGKRPVGGLNPCRARRCGTVADQRRTVMRVLLRLRGLGGRSELFDQVVLRGRRL